MKGTEITASGVIDTVEMIIIYTCCNDCIFCSERPGMDTFPGAVVPAPAVLTALRRYGRKGMKRVTFMGGEPTLHPEISTILKGAKALGWTTLLITNGAGFADVSFARENLPYTDEIILSYHSADPTVLQSIRGNASSHETIEKAIENFKRVESGTLIMTNTVVVRQNFDTLTDTVAAILSHGIVKRLTISFVAPEGVAARNYKDLVVRYSDIAGVIPAIINMTESRGASVRFFGVPLCVIHPNEVCSNDFYYDSRIGLELIEREGGVFFAESRVEEKQRLKIKTARCSKCKYQADNLCEGFFEEYYRLYGDSEIGLKD